MRALVTLLLLTTTASAADLTPKLYKAPVAPVYCTVTACTGWFVGGNIDQAGGTLDVIGTGLTGLAQNGLGLGGQTGYEYWNGGLYASLYADIASDVSLNSVPGTSFKDRLTYGVTARLGYSLASVFGSTVTAGTTPTLPQQLLSSLMTPYIDAGEVWRHGQPALRSGAGIEALVSTNWTLNVDYFHYDYNQGGSAGTLAGLPTSQANDNEVRLAIEYHLGH